LHGNAACVDIYGKSWPFGDRVERDIAFQAIRSALKQEPAQVRRVLMEELRCQFPPDESVCLLEGFPTLKMLTWAELAQLSQAGVEIGSHGVDHEIHHENQPESVRLYELSASKMSLEQKLRRPCR